MVLAGSHAEGGEDSGMLPYLIGQGLGHTIVADVAGISIVDGQAALTQALPRGRRRLIETRLPVVAIVNAAAPEPRQSAFARARRGIVETIAAEAPADDFLESCEIRPWRPRPKRMRVPTGGSALDRLKAMTETKSGAGKLLIQPSAGGGRTRDLRLSDRKALDRGSSGRSRAVRSVGHCAEPVAIRKAR